jgi:methyltransferase
VPPSLPPALVALFALVALQRLAELALSRRNLARQARAREAEPPAAFRRMVLCHVGLVALPLLEAWLRGRPPPRWALPSGIALFCLAQVVRLWALGTLGRAWNARAVVDLEGPLVTRGPYRFVRHPNYLAVVLEFVALPLAAGAWISLLSLNLLHAPVLAARIRREEHALADLPGWSEAFAERGRLFPRLAARSRAGGPARDRTGRRITGS